MKGDLLTYGLLALTTIVLLVKWLKPSPSSLPHIPALTPTAPILSLYGTYRFLVDNKGLMQEGYAKVSVNARSLIDGH
ncbi:hypothetical protein QCA50_017909 [Cerrena zonata]|uniref:Cytochrome P450 n=1 Tax=Cerrena zonata TaxID=2478898 RepID=A0AAW0FEA6_9APHY